MRTLRHIAILLPLLILAGEGFAQSKKKKEELSYKDRQKFERLYIDASKAKILQDYEQAIKLYESCVKLAPKEAAPYYELGNLYMNFGEVEPAAENAEKATELEPNNFYYRLLYAEILKSNQQFDLAIEQFEELIRQNPKRPGIYIDLALVYVFKKEYKKSIEVYDRLEEQIGVNEELKMKKQFLYLQLGEVNKAANEIEELIDFQPDRIDYYLMLAELYSANDMNDKAQRAYKNAAEKFPNDTRLQLSVANFYKSQGNYGKAFEHLKIAFADNQLDVDMKVKTILSFFDIVDRDPSFKQDLMELGAILLKTHPDDARVLTINGDISLNMGEDKLARKYFMRAVEIDDSRYPIWSQLLILEVDLRIFDTLVTHAEKAVELFPNQPVCFYFLGYGYSGLERHEEAAEAYASGVKLVFDNDPLEAQFYLSMGDAYNEAGNYAKSDEAFEKALSLDSNNTIALNNYSYYLSVRGDKLEKALRMSGRSNKLEPNQSTYLDTYAWILYRLERYEDAKLWMQKAIDNGGKNSGVILEHMGDVLFKLGEEEEALEFWNKAKEVGDASELIDKKVRDKKLYE